MTERPSRSGRERAARALLCCILLVLPLFVPAGGAVKFQSTVVAEIEAQLDKCRELLREGQKYAEALSLLSPLTAKIFGVDDKSKQMELATDLFLLRGIAFAGSGDNAGAVREFQSMFALSPALAKTAIKNIYDPNIIALLRKAEGRPQAEPAKPSETPVSAEEKQPAALTVRSKPSGARIIVDGKDTGLITNGQVSGLSPGAHSLKLVKEFYADWETKVQIPAGGALPSVEVSLTAVSYATAGSWGGPESKRFSSLGGLAIDRQDRIFVLDGGEIKVTMFNSSGEFKPLTPAGGPEFAEMVRPSGLAVDAAGKIYISDAETHFIYLLGSDGHLVSKWGGMGTANMQFNTPMGLAIDAQNNLYVADLGNACVKKISARGEFMKAFGASGSPNERLVSPRAVVINRKDEVIVLDKGRVVKFSPQGAALATFGREGSGDGEFNNPLGLGLDDDSCLYVADTGNHRIQKFDAQGRFICSWGGRGWGLGLMDTPCAVAVGRDGVVYVAERDNQRIQLFTAGSIALGMIPCPLVNSSL
jgi:DNA-binding beta-propeller fold protein YncE